MATDTLDKIVKLLHLAENTTNQAEAEAYAEKAQHLASVASIDLEMAYYRQSQKEKREEPTNKRVQTGQPGKKFKNRFWVDLLLEIAEVNDLRCTISYDRSACWMYGYPSDIEVAEILYGSLASQMVEQANASLSRGEHKERGIHGATWRVNFYHGFIEAIGFRLQKARTDAMREQKERDAAVANLASAATPQVAENDLPVTGALVMVKKKEAVNDFYAKETAGKLSRRSYRNDPPQNSSYSAQNAGARAGQAARLGTEKALPGAKKAVR